MEKGDIPKTAIITPFGLFEFNFMPFGLKNAAQTFQRLMNTLFRSFPFLFIYLDDLLIFSPTREQHLLHQQQVFDVLASNGLSINPAQCTFAVPEVDCLGHHVTYFLWPLSFVLQSPAYPFLSPSYNLTSPTAIPWHAQLLSPVSSCHCPCSPPTDGCLFLPASFPLDSCHGFCLSDCQIPSSFCSSTPSSHPLCYPFPRHGCIRLPCGRRVAAKSPWFLATPCLFLP
jgi:hypothetical protein